MKPLIIFLTSIFLLCLPIDCQTRTNNCLDGCFTSASSLFSKSYCNVNNVGYCCNSGTVNTICSSDSTLCSRGAANRNISYAYCPRSGNCGSTNETIYATYEEQTVRATGFTHERDRPCYWKLTSAMADMDSSEVIKVTVSFVFAATMNSFVGSTIGVANSQQQMITGFEYTFPIYDDSLVTTVWLVANPDNQNSYSPDILFTYQVARTSSVSAEVNFGIEPF